MGEVNEHIIHELGHTAMGVLEKVPVLRIWYDRPNGMWLTTYGKKAIIQGVEDYLMVRLYLSGPAADTLIWGGYDVTECWMDEEKAYGILLKRTRTLLSEKDKDPKQVMKEIFNECYQQLAPFYKDFLELETVYRHHLIIEGEDLREVLETFRRRMNGLPTRYGSGGARINHSTITTLHEKKAGAGTRRPA